MDETVEIIHLFRDRWVVGFYRPSGALYADGAKRLRSWALLSARARSTLHGQAKMKLARLRMAGFLPVHRYVINEPDDRIVQDWRWSRWKTQHTSDDAAFRELDAESEAVRIAARKDLADEGRARDSLNYVKQSNFGYAVSSIAKPQHVRSGFVRHSTGSGV